MLGEVPNPLEINTGLAVTPHKMESGIYPSVTRNLCTSRDDRDDGHHDHHDPNEIDDLVKVQVSIEIENYKEEMKKEVKEEIKKEEEEEKKKKKKEAKDGKYCERQCLAICILLCFIGWGYMFYSVYYDHDEDLMPAGVIAALSICGFFGAVSCACCVRCKVKQSAWRKNLRHERQAKENEPSSIDSSL